MFEQMEIAEAIYEGGAPCRNTQQAEANCASSVRNKMEEHTPCQPTLSRSELASARETMYAI